MAGEKTLHADVTWQHIGIKSIADINGKTVIMDSPSASGGTDEGPTPLEILPASLGGCIIAMMALVAQKRRIEINNLKVTVDADVTAEEITQMRYHVSIDSPAPKEQIDKLIDQSEAICPVKKALKVPIVRE